VSGREGPQHTDMPHLSPTTPVAPRGYAAWAVSHVGGVRRPDLRDPPVR